ncbi:hypothetical protein HGRIS_006186 [Hohenbuehelia grisea]|uniref:F-box domain-containing protein n=1 Tax=Hohenbuehelia grisea TaxID=104357 RepID=A0ABR3JZ70_9AGAR
MASKDNLILDEVQLQPTDDEIETRQLVLVRDQKALQELKIRRNSLLPVSKLPNDILCLIFELVRDQFTWDCWRFGIARYRLYFEWMNLTRVCQTWRLAALGCATLWRFIFVRHDASVAWLDGFLARARSVPLDIAYRNKPPEAQPSPELMMTMYLAHYHVMKALAKANTLRSVLLDVRHPEELSVAISLILPKLENVEILELSLQGPTPYTLPLGLKLENCDIDISSPLIASASSIVDGCPLDKLKIIDGRLSRGSIQLLERLVGKLEVVQDELAEEDGDATGDS